MKFVFLLLFTFVATLHADDIVGSIESSNLSLKIEEKDDVVLIEFQTQTMAGERLIYAWPQHFSGQKEIYLDYYFIQNIAASYRHLESVTVTWSIPKLDWDNWSKSDIYIRKKPDVALSADQVKTIKDDWSL